MLLKEIMRKELVTVSPDATVREVARKMKDENVGCVLVTNRGKLSGLVTDRDVACWLAGGKDPDASRVGSIMTTDLITATPQTDVFEANKTMARHRVRRLPVIEEGSVCGIVSTSDIAITLEEEVDNFFNVEKTYSH